MKTLIGTFIFFFYFIKYPLVIFLAVAYGYFEYEQNWILNTLGFISILLIFKDWFFPHDKCDCKPKNR